VFSDELHDQPVDSAARSAAQATLDVLRQAR